MNILLFLKIPFADIIADLKLLLLSLCICYASFLHSMSYFYSVQRIVVPTVHMSVALLTTGVFMFLNGFYFVHI